MVIDGKAIAEDVYLSLRASRPLALGIIVGGSNPVIDSFVRINDASPNTGTVVEGYNTDGRPTPFDEISSPPFTRSLTLGEVPLLDGGGLRLYSRLDADVQLLLQPFVREPIGVS